MKTIEIDIMCENDLYEKYNKKIVSKDLINYLVLSVPKYRKSNIKVIINNHTNIDCKNLIIDGLKNNLDKTLERYIYNNKIQIIYLMIGIILLFISKFIEEVVFNELILIISWFFIWVMFEEELSSDITNRKRRKILKKLLKSEITENKL